MTGRVKRLLRVFFRAWRFAQTRRFLVWAYLAVTIGFSVWAYVLANVAFHVLAAGQVYVIVFEQNPQTAARLTADVYPNSPWKDTVTVADDDSQHPATLLAVVECLSDPGSSTLPSNGTLTSYGAPGEQGVNVTARGIRLSPGHSSRFSLGCFRRTASGTYSIDNVTLPALGTDNAYASAGSGPPTLYYVPGSATQFGGPLVQVFPGAACTAATSAATPTAPGTSPAAPSPSGSQSPTASPSPSVQSSPGCFLNGPYPGPVFRRYFLPQGMRTREQIHRVDWGSYQIESEYPNPISTGNNFYWMGSNVLTPSLHVLDPASDKAISEDTFVSGILFGIAAATALALLDQIVKLREEKGEGSTPAAQDRPDEGST